MSTDKNKLIPELRFPEFMEDGDWKIKSINDLCDILNNLRKPISGSDRKKGDYPYYGASGIIDYVDEYIFDERLLLVGEDGAKWNAFENTAFLVKEKYWVNNHAHVLKPIKINDKLLESYLVKLDLQPYITGAAPPKLTLGKLKNIPIPVPENPQEQQKIASCLSSLDEVIAVHSQKLATLKDHKKGLMQNLFPTNSITNDELEITNVPNYRFPEFLEDGEWVVKKLEEVAIFLKGKGISKADIVENGNLACIRYGELYTHYQETISEIKSYTNLDAANLVLSKANDIIIPASGETQIDIATASCVLEKGIALGGDLNIIRTKINGVFLSYYLNNAKKMEIAQMAQGISVVHLYPSQLKTLVISIPKPEEQQKIAFCLSSLDELITAQTEKIAQLKLHKKGLMQGLFPKSITN
jgi:type I restriction enzyme S subunit